MSEEAEIRGLDRWPRPKSLEGGAPVWTSRVKKSHDLARAAMIGNLRGKLYDAELIRKNVEYLEALRPLLEQAGSWQGLLSGESTVSSPPEGQGGISDRRALNEAGVRETDDRMAAVFGVAVANPDYKDLSKQRPAERYKFYSSFDLTTPEKVALGEQWLAEVAKMAHEQGITLTTKSFDHAYDSMNLYTWHPVELAEIIKSLYPKYLEAGLYHSTPHFLQGQLEGVDPDHIGWVQEPKASVSNGSHSVRMGKLGKVLDEAASRGETLTPELFRKAADEAGVDVARPYLIAA